MRCSLLCAVCCLLFAVALRVVCCSLWIVVGCCTMRLVVSCCVFVVGCCTMRLVVSCCVFVVSWMCVFIARG